MKPTRSLFLSLLLSATASHAAAITWTGAAAGDWNTVGNWSGAAVPLITDDLTLLGPANVAGTLAIDLSATANANTINFTDTAAVSLTNTASGADRTLTLQGGLTTGTGAVTLGSVTANQGVKIALGASQVWNIGSGGLTVNNAISGTGFGITKSTGTGTLTLAGTNTFTGATAINAGTIQYNASTAMSSGSAVTMASGATLALAADAVTTFTTSLFTGPTTGNYAISVNQITGAGAGKTLTLTSTAAMGVGTSGTITVSSTSGDTLAFNSAFQLANPTANTTFYLNGANVTLNGVANAANPNGSGIIVTSSGSNSLTINGNWGLNTARYGVVRVDSGVVNLNNTTGGSGANWGLAANLNGGTLNINNNGAVGGGGGGNSLTLTSGTLNNNSGAAITQSKNPAITLGGNFAFGGSNDLNLGTGAVGLGTAAAATRTLTTNGSATLTVGGIISNASNGIAKAGTGTLVLTGANTYAGPTTINGGTLTLSGTTGSINSSAITINGSGAKLLQTSSAAGTSGVTLTLGTLAGTGTVGAVTVANTSGAIVSNGNSNTTALTAASLAFGGAATLNLNYGGTSPALAVTGALSTTPASGAVTINELNALSWTNGQSYNLLSFGSSTASATDFTLGTIAGLTARQVSALSLTASNVVMTIAGDTPRWDGTTGNNNWTSSSSVTNWKLATAGTSTYFLASNDAALFDDNASNTTVNILDSSVTPLSVTFNNSTKAYTLTGNGIAGSTSLVKNGSGTTTLSNRGNSYTGGTTVNAGTLALSGSGTLGATTGSVTVNGATAVLNLGSTSQTSGTVSLVNGTIQSGSLTASSYAMESGTVSANLLGAGALTKATSGTVALSGANTFTGATTISAGILQYNASSAMSTSSAVSIASGGTLALAADANTTFTPASVTGPASSYTISVNQLTGAGANKTLTLANFNGFTGGVSTLSVSSSSGDTLQLGSAYIGSSSFATGNPSTINLNNANLVFNAGISGTDPDFVLTSATGNSLTIKGTVTQNGANQWATARVNSGTLTLNNTVTNLGGLNNGFGVYLNGGTLNYNAAGAIAGAGDGNNNRGGSLNIAGGTLDNTSGSALTATGLSFLNINGDFTFAGSNNLNLGTGAANLGSSAGTTRTLTTNGAATLTLGGIIANGTTATGITKAGTGTLALNGINTYTGATTVNGGTLTLSGTGSINNSAITVNGAGAKLLQTSSAAGTSGVTLTLGTLAGTGTVGAVTVANTSGAIISNGNSNTTALTAGSLAFGGAATLNLNYGGTSPALAVTGALSTTPASGPVTINELNALSWTNGQSYTLLSFGSSTASAADFTLGTIAGLTPRQVPALSLTGSNVVMTIAGDAPRWDGTTGNNDWTSNSSITNWKLIATGTSTHYLNNDAALFDDNASNTTVNILDSSVTPLSVTFNNSTKAYTLTGNGIAGSTSLVKNGSGTTTLSNTGNSYTGGTTVNAGTLALSGSGTLGATTGAVTVNGATAVLDLGATSQTVGAVTLVDGTIRNGNLTGASYALENGAVSANLLGAGALAKTTSGTVALSGANTFTGATTISAGILQYNASSAMSTASAISIASGGTLSLVADANTTFTPASVTGPASSYTIAVNQLTGAGAGKTLTLANFNGFTGGVSTLSVSSSSGDTLQLGSAYNGSSSFAFGNPSTLNLNNANLVFNNGIAGTQPDFQLTSATGNTLTINGAVTGGSNTWATARVNSGTLTLHNSVTNLSGLNNGFGVYLNGGTLNYNAAGAIAGAGDGNNNRGGSLNIAGGTLDNTSGSALTATGLSYLNINGDFTFAGSNSLTLGAGAANLGASAGTTRTLTTNGAATLTLGGIIANGTTATGITKAGTGTLALTGANTYTGATTVTAGTLALGAAGSIANSASVTLAAGAVLNTSAHASFAIPATQPIVIDINPAGAGSSGRIHAAGLGIATAVVSFSAAGTLDDAVYVIADYTSLTGTAFAAATPPSGYTINYSYNSGTQIALVKAGYASWADANAPGQAMNQDHDHDGVMNGIEYFMGQTGSSFTSMPVPVNGTVTWPMGASYTGTYGTDYEVQTSSDLVTWVKAAQGTGPDTVTVTPGTSVAFTLPTGSTKVFTRLVVNN